MDKLAHRKGTARLRVLDRQGTPVPNADAHVEMTKHAFLFGSGAFEVTPFLMRDTPEEERNVLEKLLDNWLALFNYGTLSFYWGRYEATRGKTLEKITMDSAKWLLERGVTLKGHPLCWHTATARWLLELDSAEVERLQLERIRRDVTAFRGMVDIWDVLNELVIMPEFTAEDNGITRLCQKLGRDTLAMRVFQEARKANPDACLLLNDFNTSDRYRELLEELLNIGVPIDVIGIQSHQHQGYWGLEKLDRVLTRFEGFGLPIHFTENTLISGDLMPPEIVDLNDFKVKEWPSTPAGEDRQARELLEQTDFLFERKSVKAITQWSAIDGGWLGAPAGLLRKDASPKPAYDALLQRVKHDWWTREELHTNENGELEVHGFLGDYELRMGDHAVPFAVKPEDDQLTTITVG